MHDGGIHSTYVERSPQRMDKKLGGMVPMDSRARLSRELYNSEFQSQARVVRGRSGCSRDRAGCQCHWDEGLRSHPRSSLTDTIPIGALVSVGKRKGTNVMDEGLRGAG